MIVMINKKVKLGPKPKEQGKIGDDDFKKYTEAELKYLEVCLVREHLGNAKQFDFNPRSMDPEALIQMYQKNKLSLPGAEEQAKRSQRKIKN